MTIFVLIFFQEDKIGMDPTVFLQDEDRAQIQREYACRLEKRLKKQDDLEFLNYFKPNYGGFIHSGLACRKHRKDKILQNNSIRKVN